jgi:hypothetical protein
MRSHSVQVEGTGADAYCTQEFAGVMEGAIARSDAAAPAFTTPPRLEAKCLPEWPIVHEARDRLVVQSEESIAAAGPLDLFGWTSGRHRLNRDPVPGGHIDGEMFVAVSIKDSKAIRQQLQSASSDRTTSCGRGAQVQGIRRAKSCGIRAIAGKRSADSCGASGATTGKF